MDKFFPIQKQSTNAGRYSYDTIDICFFTPPNSVYGWKLQIRTFREMEGSQNLDLEYLDDLRYGRLIGKTYITLFSLMS